MAIVKDGRVSKTLIRTEPPLASYLNRTFFSLEAHFLYQQLNCAPGLREEIARRHNGISFRGRNSSRGLLKPDPPAAAVVVTPDDRWLHYTPMKPEAPQNRHDGEAAGGFHYQLQNSGGPPQAAVAMTAGHVGRPYVSLQQALIINDVSPAGGAQRHSFQRPMPESDSFWMADGLPSTASLTARSPHWTCFPGSSAVGQYHPPYTTMDEMEMADGLPGSLEVDMDYMAGPLQPSAILNYHPAAFAGPNSVYSSFSSSSDVMMHHDPQGQHGHNGHHQSMGPLADGNNVMANSQHNAPPPCPWTPSARRHSAQMVGAAAALSSSFDTAGSSSPWTIAASTIMTSPQTEATISPKMLKIAPTPSPSASTESVSSTGLLSLAPTEAPAVEATEAAAPPRLAAPPPRTPRSSRTERPGAVQPPTPVSASKPRRHLPDGASSTRHAQQEKAIAPPPGPLTTSRTSAGQDGSGSGGNKPSERRQPSTSPTSLSHSTSTHRHHRADTRAASAAASSERSRRTIKIRVGRKKLNSQGSAPSATAPPPAPVKSSNTRSRTAAVAAATATTTATASSPAPTYTIPAPPSSSHPPPLAPAAEVFPAVAARKAVPTPQPQLAPPPPDESQREERRRKDEFLLEAKREGLTYKEIRERGGFAEAESTLRGRYRALTKAKSERVRKPEWEERDDRLLRRAVRKLGAGSSNKIPWKKVAQYIVDHGGSYHFGNTTCRKRWDHLLAADSGEDDGEDGEGAYGREKDVDGDGDGEESDDEEEEE